ncbi:sensor domain-containing protein [Halopseudomonas salegens]|uniref:PAS domain S-box-containing protein/diguanylate cyclase (GGDEF) domain-containing protein n=1 Tax=Halopseudomonas salegens TaxID=1434072 RepID=A0A1H2E641_9GAMM|nr:bifunctional diguanylate cyclase/phosphodiesterase [Halopseudomonas salegens]SDT90666.1 PAS domain S-box-containing protein/diguanylate cyclase (GGDEF) domain-containing protein [Halopseudomonas salegens]
MPLLVSPEEGFRQLAAGVASARGDAAFSQLLRALDSILPACHWMIAECQPDYRQARSLAVLSGGELLDNRLFAITAEPYRQALARGFFHAPDGLQESLPDDPLRQDFAACSCVALALGSDGHKGAGLLVGWHDQPMTLGALEREALQIAVSQASVELSRRQAVSVAQHNEHRLHALMSHLPGMVYRCQHDADWTMDFVSQGAYQLTGYPVEQLLQDTRLAFGRLIHPDDRARAFACVDEAIAVRAPYQLTYRLLTADRGYRWMWEQGQAVEDAEGGIAYLEGFISDVTEQQQAQRIQRAVLQIATAVTAAGTDDYLQRLVEKLCAVLASDICYIARLVPTGRMQVLAGVAEGQAMPMFDYDPSGRACEQILKQGELALSSEQALDLDDFPEGAHFPVHHLIGRRLDNAAGDTVGVLISMQRSTPEDPEFATSVCRILASGAAAELERQGHDVHMQRLAFVDELTGLPNRVRFINELDKYSEQVPRPPLGLLLIDLARFKEINDSLGHEMGDHLLQAVSRRLQQSCFADVFLARLGGDEFAMLLPRSSEANLQRQVSELRRQLELPVRLHGHEFSLEANLGAVLCRGDSNWQQGLLQQASIALHHAKTSGNGFCLFSRELGDLVNRKHRMLEKLLEALAQNRLQLFFQPQIDLQNGRLCGAEALCRWQDAEWGWVSPAEFIVLAEERGLMRQLGDWVLRAACRQLLAWQQAGQVLPGRLSLNLSAQQLETPDLASHIRSCCHPLDPSLLNLELTESALVRDPDQAVLITRSLREAGFQLAIDDFGTGYSSLSYLKRFAADTLKIDMSFVRDMLVDSHDRAIVETIIAMARALGMRTTAEGVEQAEQATLLKSMGCDEAQGYYYGHALDADDFTRQWLDTSTV